MLRTVTLHRDNSTIAGQGLKTVQMLELSEVWFLDSHEVSFVSLGLNATLVLVLFINAIQMNKNNTVLT